MRFAITLTVDAMGAQRNLADWLCYMLLDESEASVMAAIDSGRVTIGGVQTRDPKATLAVGAEVRFQEAAAS